MVYSELYESQHGSPAWMNSHQIKPTLADFEPLNSSLTSPSPHDQTSPWSPKLTHLSIPHLAHNSDNFTNPNFSPDRGTVQALCT